MTRSPIELSWTAKKTYYISMLKVKTRKQANSSLLDTSSSSLNSIRAGQKFQKRGRRGEERVAGRREEEERRKISLSLKEEKRR